MNYFTQTVANPLFDNKSPALWISVIVAPLLIVAILHKLFFKKLWYPKNEPKSTETHGNTPLGLEAIPPLQPVFPIKFFGNIPFTVPPSKLINYVENKVKTCGDDIVRVFAFNHSVVVVNSAPILESLLRSRNLGHMMKANLLKKIIERVLQIGFLIANGKEWHTQRKIIARAQNSSVLEAQIETVCWHGKYCVQKLEKLFANGPPSAIKSILSNLFLGIVVETTTGFRDPDTPEYAEFRRNFETIVTGFGKRLTNPLVHLVWKLLPFSWKYNRAVDEFTAFTQRRVMQHKEKRRLEAESGAVEKMYHTVVDELLEAGTEEKQIVEDVKSLFFAGMDTTLAATEFFCMMMSVNLKHQRECQGEVDELFSKNPEPWSNGTVTLDMATEELKYLERCILETLRLYPPLFGLARQLGDPLDIQYNGNTVRLPVGTNVVYSPYLMHRKEEYFPEPTKFDPDRFLPEETKKRHPYSYLPFSLGPRNCVASRFAIVELKVVLAYLLRNFNFETVDKLEDIPLMPYIVLAPQRSYRFRLTKRNL